MPTRTFTPDDVMKLLQAAEPTGEGISQAINQLQPPNNSMVSLVDKRPADCSEEERSAFQQIVERAGEVSAVGLSAHIENAHKLIFLWRDDELIGAAGIKNPRPAYRARVEQSAQVDLSAYPVELGWVSVREGCKRRGYGRHLVEAALRAADGNALFATTREANVGMTKLLRQFDFIQAGQAYSPVGKSYRLLVFGRSAPNPKALPAVGIVV